MTQQQTQQNSAVIVHKSGGTSFVGPDAVNLFRASTLKSGLKLFAETGMKLTRGVTGPMMLKMATEYTGKTYRGTDKYVVAAADMKKWIDTMKAAMPVEHKP